MKLRTFLLLLLLHSSTSQAASFGPGYVMIGGGLEYGAAFVILDDPDATTESNGYQIFRNVPAALEVGINEHMGMGLQFRKCKYLGEGDSIKAGSIDYGIFFNYHFVVTNQTNSFAGIRAGISDLSFEKTRTAETFEKKGPAFQLYGGVNMLIVSKLGLQLTLGLNSSIYKDGELVDPRSPIVKQYGVSIHGLDMGMGIFFIL
ncbi:MAG: hypothetical protein ACKO1U_08080 [Bacteroidota bacterium]